MILESITGRVNSAWQVWSPTTSEDNEAIRRGPLPSLRAHISETANGIRSAQLIAGQTLRGWADELKKRTLALRLSSAPGLEKADRRGGSKVFAEHDDAAGGLSFHAYRFSKAPR